MYNVANLWKSRDNSSELSGQWSMCNISNLLKSRDKFIRAALRSVTYV